MRRRSARVGRWLEIVSTVLLAFATVGTAWSGYQAKRWGSEQAKAAASANASRVESAKASGVANRAIQIDVAVFIQWTNAFALREQELQDFYRRRMSPRLEPAMDPWLATKPRANPDAPLTPFVMPQYKVPELAEVDRLTAKADASGAQARGLAQRSDNYILAVVLFAMALFFAGIATKLGSRTSRTAILCLGCLVFVATVVWIATFPVSLDV